MRHSVDNGSPWLRSNAFTVYDSVENALTDPFCGQKPRSQFAAGEVLARGAEMEVRSMLSISEEAIAVLHETLHESGLGGRKLFCLASGPEGLGLDIGVPSVDARVIQHGDHPVLFVEPEVERSIGAAVIEVAPPTEQEEARLVIRRL